MLREAVAYPTSGDDGVEAVLFAGALLVLSAFVAFVSVFLLLIPVVLAIGLHLVVRGYYVRVMRWTTRHPDADAPPFDDWGRLLVDGLKAGVVALLYWMPAIGLFGLAVVVAGLSGVSQVGSAVEAVNTVTGLLVLAGGLYVVAVLYLLPAAVANFAYHDELGAAFRLREVAAGALSEDYAVGWVFTLVYQLVTWPVVTLLSVFLVGTFLQAHVGISVRWVYGRSLRAGLDLETRPPPAADDDEAGSGPTDEREGFVDLGELVDEPDRPSGVAGPAADDGEWTEEFRERTGGDEADDGS